MFCRKCGNEMFDGDRYCLRCGFDNQSVNPPQTQQLINKPKKKKGCLIPLVIMFVIIILLFKGCASLFSTPELITEPPTPEQAKDFIVESLKYVEESNGQLYSLDLATQQYSVDNDLHQYKKSVAIKHEQIKNAWHNYHPECYNNQLLTETQNLISTFHLFQHYEYSKNIGLYLEKLDESYSAKALDAITNANYITYEDIIIALKDVAVQSGLAETEINELFQ